MSARPQTSPPLRTIALLFLVLVLPGALAADGGAQDAAPPEDDCPFIIFRCLPFDLFPFPALKLECLCVP